MTFGTNERDVFCSKGRLFQRFPAPSADYYLFHNVFAAKTVRTFFYLEQNSLPITNERKYERQATQIAFFYLKINQIRNIPIYERTNIQIYNTVLYPSRERNRP